MTTTIHRAGHIAPPNTTYEANVYWLTQAQPDTVILDTSPTGDPWRKGPDHFWYRPGVEAGYNPECVAMEGPFICIKAVS